MTASGFVYSRPGFILALPKPTHIIYCTAYVHYIICACFVQVQYIICFCFFRVYFGENSALSLHLEYYEVRPDSEVGESAQPLLTILQIRASDSLSQYSLHVLSGTI